MPTEIYAKPPEEDDSNFTALVQHTEHCTICKKANKYVNKMCPTGVALFFSWNPEPLYAENRDLKPEEYQELKDFWGRMDQS